jgi:polysaccharide biosynthesis transport protein
MIEEEIHLRDYLNVLIKRRYTVFTVFITVFVIVLIATLSMTPIYTATTRVLIEKSQPQSMYNFPYVEYDPDFYETQYELIKSSSVAKRVINLLSLESNTNRAAFEKKIGKQVPGVDKDTDKNSVAAQATRSDLLGSFISGGISVTPIPKTKLVNISYASPDPELASMIANTVAKAYIEEILEMKMSSARHTIEWMTRKAAEEQGKLKNSDLALQQYMRANEFVTLENKVAIIPEKLSDANSQLIQAETKRKEIEAVYEKVKNISGNTEAAETIPFIASDQTLQFLNAQILKAEQNIDELSKKYGQKHPVMIKAVGELEILKSKRKREIPRIIESIKNQYELARSNEDNIRKLFSNVKGEALNVNEKFVQYNVLKREADTSQQLYETLMKKIKEQSITEELQTVNVWIIEEAHTPRSPTKPNKMRNILIGIITGLLGGIGLAFFGDYLDNTISNPDEAEKKFGQPVLGVIPFYEDIDKDVENSILMAQHSTLSESYKAVRTSILLSAAEHPPKKILVTSMLPEEGKTFTSVNLAMVLAQAGYSVLLLDADMRKPRLHKIFKLDNTQGISTYLAGVSELHINESCADTVKNLSVITSGPVPPNPSELLVSGKLNDLIQSLSEKFDFVICDSPPVLTVTDGLILSKAVDSTIVVVRAGKTTYDLLGRGLRSLDDIKAHVTGLVINALVFKKSGYYQYKSYLYHDHDYADKK